MRLSCTPFGASGGGGLRPVTCGVPFPRGAVQEAGRLSLADRPLQVRVLETWPDDSVRWALLDFQAGPGEEVAVVEGPPSAPAQPLRVTLATDDRRAEVDTGVARFALGRGFPFESEGLQSELLVEDESGRKWEHSLLHLEVESAGPLRACLVLHGLLTAAEPAALARVRTELHFFAGSSTVRVELCLTNPRAAGHPGGAWPLGQPGSIFLREVAVRFTLAGTEPGQPACSPMPGAAFERLSELYQDSSGGPHWDSRNHLDRFGRVAPQFQGWRMDRRTGDRATPVAELRRDGRRVALAMTHFWENFPKAVEATAGWLKLALFPRQAAGGHELQGGEQKTHVFHVTVGGSDDLEWVRAPLLAHARPEWYAAAEVLPRLVPRAADPDARHFALAELALDPASGFAAKAEAVDEFGWRHFGDLWADHEEAYCKDPRRPVISHYNNQYDVIFGAAVCFFRTGDPRWFHLFDTYARHVLDIDVYRATGDKSAYNGGLFWHTAHYLDAGTSTHRTFPPGQGVGGGPSAGHLYNGGLLFHWLLTGHRPSRDTAVDLGHYVIRADDGRTTVFRFLDRGPTGHVSSSGEPGYHGPGRSPANAIVALLNAHRLSGEPALRNKTIELVRRCGHPHDDLAARNLGDAENRWFYTMFCQALGRFCEAEAARGEVGADYAYARATLLHYARWAAEHEYPYLDKPEILEYPTETWAGQDMRKAELLRFAAMHTEGDERARFEARARFFFEASVERLGSMPTKTYTRPIALMMTNGHEEAWFVANPGGSAPRPALAAQDFGAPQAFIPQKARAKRKLVMLAAAGALGVPGLAAWWWFSR